ncbi:MAG: S24/S26 family peptidase [Acidobacteriia bacterium]|nr:S24/S26 family peptidase [Terriglobia bacterium]
MSTVLAADQRCKCSLASEVLGRFGELRLQVTGSSMLPSLWPGDLLLIRRAQLSEITTGELVLFTRQERFFVHRVERALGTCLLTRGDSLAATDAPVGADEFLGRVVFISREGATRTPAVLSPCGRWLAGAASRSTIFCNFLLRLRALFLRIPRVSLFTSMHPEEVCPS